MSHLRLHLAVATATTALVALAAPALGAATTSTSSSSATRSVSAVDPDDVGNRLDIVRERFTTNTNGSVTLRVDTAETWRCV